MLGVEVVFGRAVEVSRGGVILGVLVTSGDAVGFAEGCEVAVGGDKALAVRAMAVGTYSVGNSVGNAGDKEILAQPHKGAIARRIIRRG